MPRLVFNMHSAVCLLILSLIFAVSPGYAQRFQGQLSGWSSVTSTGSEEAAWNAGIRYLPELSWELARYRQFNFDTDISGNLYGSASGESAGAVKPYRAWVRMATHRFEARLGLQRIDFGPAKLLRALMWFDRRDPRDPLQLTDGVWGLRMRYDFDNLASLWTWGLYGQNHTKGLEFIPSKKQSLEYGGRLQYPVGSGEIGVTLHHRSVDAMAVNPALTAGGRSVAENRFGLDGIWDVGVGLWFESALIHANYAMESFKWQSFLTVGSDYTIAIGNGLHLLGEHMLFTMSDIPFDLKQKTQISAMMLSYPLNMLDQIAFYSVFTWDPGVAYHYISWQRTYDRWMIYVSLFGRMGKSSISLLNQPLATLGDKGIQLMIIFNH